MFLFIRNLQNRPEEYRKRFAFFLALSITLVIVGIWISVKSVSMGSPISVEVEDVVEDSGPSASPFRTFGDDIARVRDGFMDSIKSFGSVEYSKEDKFK